MQDSNSHEHWMQKALALAQEAGDCGEVPVGAVIVRDGELIGQGYNRPISSNDPTAHAEIVALRDAGSHEKNYRLPGSVLYVTIEPCAMCVGAMVHARVAMVVFGAREPKAGALVSNLGLHEQGFLNHRLEIVEGVLKEKCGDLLSDFFRSRRA